MNYVRTAMLIALMTALFMAVGYAIGGSGGMMIALVIAAVMNLFGYWNADKMVLRMHNAVQVDAQTAPELHAMVAELARRANLPMPKVYVIDNPQPNAFATGRNPQNAAVAVHTGLLDQLNKDEVAAVIAHELAHVENRDTLTMTITATLAGAISMLGNFAMFAGGGNRNNNGFGMIGVLFAMIVAPFAAMMVQMAVSRTREYAADRRGGQIVGNPLWLASALRKISGGVEAIRNPTAEANPATAHLFIYNPLHGDGADSPFTTHPSVQNRVAALQRQAEEMGAATRQASTSPSAAETSRASAPRVRPRPAQETSPQAGPWGAPSPDPQPPAEQPSPGPWGRNGGRRS